MTHPDPNKPGARGPGGTDSVPAMQDRVLTLDRGGLDHRAQNIWTAWACWILVLFCRKSLRCLYFLHFCFVYGETELDMASGPGRVTQWFRIRITDTWPSVRGADFSQSLQQKLHCCPAPTAPDPFLVHMAFVWLFFRIYIFTLSIQIHVCVSAVLKQCISGVLFLVWPRTK